ncbi:MAG: SMODS domain-containing nucleotidyltransferase [Fimbriimonas sp.]
MKLIDYFRSFLENEVNLDEPRLARLNGSVEAITGFLEASATFADNFNDVIPQGSYAHKTIIQPVRKNDEFDADLLLHVKEFPEWEAEDYVEELYRTFRASGVYKDKAHRQTRCVTIDYAGDFHVDVVPFLERHGSKWVTNRNDNEFELTDPEGYNAWLDMRNKAAERRLVPVIRLLKYLRDYKRTFDVKSVVLNVLVGERVSEIAQLADPGCYADVPTTLRTVMNALKEYLEPRIILPTISDPSGTGENFGDRWSQEGYASFRTAMIRYAQWIEDAWSDGNVDSSVTKWQRVVGDEFKKPEERKSAELVRASFSLPVPYKATEQNLVRDLGIRFAVNPAYRFRLSGRVSRVGGIGAYYLHDRGNKVRRGRHIRFKVEDCSVPEPFTIYWKVLNRGEEAKSNDAVRGEIEAGGRVWKYDEPTSFTGPHFVEAYAVRDGVCVAMDRQEVIII